MTRIGIDVDDVVYDFDGTVREFFVDNYMADWAPEPLSEAQRLALQNGSHGGLWDGVAEIVGQKNWTWMWENIDDTAMFRRGKPLPGAVGALKELEARGHEVWLLTARKPRYAYQTYEWLSNWQLSPAGVVHGKSKWKLASALDFRVVVDDGPDNLRGYLLRTKGSLKGAFVYGIEHYEPVTSSYYRFKYVKRLEDILEDEERWS